MRTIENYIAAVKENHPSKTGVKRESIFNELPHFHIIRAVCVDIMHDFYEGICKHDVGFVLQHYVCVSKYFSVDYLNTCVNSYDFDSNDKRSKPPSFDEKHVAKQKISLSASEMRCFVQNLPLIIGHRVPQDDELWHVILKPREIMKIVFAPHFQIEICGYLKTLIAEYLQTLIQLGMKLRPKHHLLTHYPAIMLEKGPLGRLSSMRYESKHRVNKVIASTTTSRVNICKTIAIKNQLIFCQRLVADKGSYPTYTLGPLGLKYMHEFNGQRESVTSTKHLIFLGHKIKIENSIIIRAKEIHMKLFFW